MDVRADGGVEGCLSRSKKVLGLGTKRPGGNEACGSPVSRGTAVKAERDRRV